MKLLIIMLTILHAGCSKESSNKAKTLLEGPTPTVVIPDPDETEIEEPEPDYQIIDVTTGEVINEKQLSQFISNVSKICLESIEAKEVQAFLKEIEPSILEKSYYYYNYESKEIAREILKEHGVLKKLEYLASQFAPTGCTPPSEETLEIIDIVTNEVVTSEEVIAFLSYGLDLKPEIIVNPKIQDFLKSINPHHFQKVFYIYFYEDKEEARSILKRLVITEKAHDIAQSL